ncbi:hypothetical protein AWL63_08985 [Sphingomonas panacis]|uniref:Circumsporozoite protein n=1 Tax=Sphingomonas panacis TaxID=1560345 RepID=A0A1B3Z9H2_9SPHN|nr:hypothetical protein [Sphingomonas panacis]AOH84083.1 hypothetical protein AWL63_08985 [Sphingomonas panacis]
MRKLAFPALVAAALAVTGCARQADDANATALNDIVLNDADGANLSATDSLDGNATDSNATETSANAL